MRLLLVLLATACCGGAEMRVIVDTDAGSDDMMAIGFLLARPGVRVEAITVVNGLAHVEAGGRNLLRLLELAAKPDVPVRVGRPGPSAGTAEFPREWRQTSDNLPGVWLPATARSLSVEGAAAYLARRLGGGGERVRLLCLGPLTNVAEALAIAPEVARGIEEIVMMGGAVGVPGNLGDGGVYRTDNRTAEWNFYVDPAAAERVFAAGIPILMVGLDATNQVPVKKEFLRDFTAGARGRLGRFVAQVLATDRPMIEGGYFYAWDPLAAAALVEPAVMTARPAAIEIGRKAPEEGRSREVAGGRANARVAVGADGSLFRRIFFEAFR